MCFKVSHGKALVFLLQTEGHQFHPPGLQVQRLCTKSIITDKVLLMEKLENMYQQQRKYLVNESRPDTTPISQLLQERYNSE